MIRRVASAVVLGIVLFSSVPALAQEPGDEPSSQASADRVDPKVGIAKFLAGAGTAFVIHESGHLALDEIFGAHPRLEAVHFGPFPFFAITPRRPLSSR